MSQKWWWKRGKPTVFDYIHDPLAKWKKKSRSPCLQVQWSVCLVVPPPHHHVLVVPTRRAPSLRRCTACSEGQGSRAKEDKYCDPRRKVPALGWWRLLSAQQSWCAGLAAEFPRQSSAGNKRPRVSVLVGKLGFLVINWFVYMFTSVLGSFPKVRRVDKYHLFFPSEAHALAALQAPWAQHRSSMFETHAMSPRESCPQGPRGWQLYPSYPSSSYTAFLPGLTSCVSLQGLE